MMDMDLKWIVKPESIESDKICFIVFKPCNERTCSFCMDKSCFVALDL